MKPQRFSSSCQLQYLLHTRGINHQKLIQEMREYFRRTGIPVQQTANNKVTGWHGALPKKTRAEAAPAKKSKPVGVKTSTVSVTYRRRRTMEPH